MTGNEMKWESGLLLTLSDSQSSSGSLPVGRLILVVALIAVLLILVLKDKIGGSQSQEPKPKKAAKQKKESFKKTQKNVDASGLFGRKKGENSSQQQYSNPAEDDDDRTMIDGDVHPYYGGNAYQQNATQNQPYQNANGFYNNSVQSGVQQNVNPGGYGNQTGSVYQNRQNQNPYQQNAGFQGQQQKPYGYSQGNFESDTTQIIDNGPQYSSQVNSSSNFPKLALLQTRTNQRFECVLDRELIIGRLANASDVIIPGDGAISDQQFTIRCEHGTYIIRDLHSANGTFVNGARIYTDTVIQNNDVIRIGNTELRVLAYN